ncbi:type II secretion system protein [Echinimonas agarilytica]|uniref:type II secretion system protein n=1 Tax=Echinimonas agarilytica TaxID=1215918 RepID=UPI002557FFAD|nr:type II secretion system protein [Echinimonas agarilytica]
MKLKFGFTLIELVLVVIVLAILAVTVLPRFVNLKTDSYEASLASIHGTIAAANDMVASEIYVRPQNLNAARSRFTLSDGQIIRIRAGFPDGRWNQTFQHIVDISGADQVSTQLCSTANWCVRQRGNNWFRNQGLTAATEGRGFVLFPRGYNFNTQRCYAYFFTPNGSATPANPLPPVHGVDHEEC